MPAILPNTPTANDYPATNNPAGTQVGLNDVFATGYFVVANAAAYAQYQHGQQGQQDFSADIFLPPATYPLVGTKSDPLGGLRFKSAVAGVPAQVFGVLYKEGEASLLAGSEFSSQISSGGGISPLPGTIIDYVTAIPGGSADGTVIALKVDPINFPGVVWTLRYNLTDNYWEFLGGSPIEIIVNTLETATAVGWQNLATNGPLWAALWQGDYLVSGQTGPDAVIGGMQLTGLSVEVGNVAGAVPYVTIDLTAVPQSGGIFMSKILSGVPLGGVIKHRYYAANANAVRHNSRVLHVQPIRIR